MKNNMAAFYTGLVICLALVGYYGYLIYTSKSVAVTAPPSTDPLDQLSTTIFSDPVFQSLKTKDANGPLPITVNPAELGKSNPFQ